MANSEDDQPKRGRGRPEGSMNRLAREAREKAAATGLLPHEILLSMARGEPQTEFRVDADGKVTEKLVALSIDQRMDSAKAAAPFYAPKINSVEVTTGISDADLDSLIASLAAEAGVSLGDGRESPPRTDSGRTRRVWSDSDEPT